MLREIYMVAAIMNVLSIYDDAASIGFTSLVRSLSSTSLIQLVGAKP